MKITPSLGLKQLRFHPYRDGPNFKDSKRVMPNPIHLTSPDQQFQSLGFPGFCVSRAAGPDDAVQTLYDSAQSELLAAQSALGTPKISLVNYVQ